MALLVQGFVFFYCYSYVKVCVCNFFELEILIGLFTHVVEELVACLGGHS